MFLTCRRGYYRDGSQQGMFLALFCDESHNIWGIVRYLRMTQLGQFMMGTMRIGSQQITMSGTYGDDGLPDDVDKIDEANRKYLTPVPPALKEIFWKGGGHNSAGAEAQDMHAWGMSILSPQQRANIARGSGGNLKW